MVSCYITTIRRLVLQAGILFLLFSAGHSGSLRHKESDQSANLAAITDTVSGKLFDLGTIVVTATRVAEYAFESPVLIQSLSGQHVRSRAMSRTLPDALKEIPAVMIQKTSYGQGSPYIRGFTGFHTLVLVDGVRLNNSVFREGPNQYAGTIDPLLASRFEIVKGPGSSLYGSDAVGGTVNVVTSGVPSGSDRLEVHSNLYYRYATADRSSMGRIEMSGSVRRTVGFRIGYSDKRFGDLRPGGGGVLPKTGYDESVLDADLEINVTEQAKLQFAHQQLGQDDVWRTHRTIYGVSWDGTTIGTDRHLSLDQRRELTYVRFSKSNRTGFLDRMTAQVSHHLQTEDQFRIKNDTSSEKQGFRVRTIGAALQGETKSRLGDLTYGLDFYHDRVSSYKRTYRADGSLKKIEAQGPIASGSSFQQLEGYVEDKISLSDGWRILPTIRFTRVDAQADRAATPDPMQAPLMIDRQWNHLTASIRTLAFLDQKKRWNLFGSVANAFRAPNLSDLTRFDIARSGEQELPAADLSPENFVCYEAGLKHLSSSAGAQIAFFYTTIDNLIIRTPTGLKLTSDSLSAVTKKNSGRGYVYGIECSVQWAISKPITITATASWLTGELETYATSSPVMTREPLDRLMPPAGNLSIRWEPPEGGTWIEFSAVGAADRRHLSTADKRDTQRIPSGGTPGYALVSVRGGFSVRPNLTVSAALENLTDRAYRIHGSGQNEAGRNFILATNISF